MLLLLKGKHFHKGCIILYMCKYVYNYLKCQSFMDALVGSVFLNAFDFWVDFFVACLYISMKDLVKEKPRTVMKRSTSRIFALSSSISVVSIHQWTIVL